MKLDEVFNEIIKSKDIWAYYRRTRIYAEKYKSFEEILSDYERFITSYLSDGGKMTRNVDAMIDYIDYVKKGEREYRLKHTISMYFLGIVLYEKIAILKFNINRFLNELWSETSHKNDKIPFSYFWFQVCFFHDLGYGFEIADIGTSLYKLTELLDGKDFMGLHSNSKGIPNEIVKNIYRYLYYVLFEVPNANLEHGIMGGCLYFDDRERALAKARIDTSNYTRLCEDSYVSGDGLLYSNDLLYEVQVPIAWTIGAHNVWVIKNNSKYVSKYKEYCLDELISDTPLIHINQHPMLYLLSIVDTIDLFKDENVGNTSFIKNAKKVCIEFMENGFSFHLGRIYNNKKDREKYISNVKAMMKWIKCKVNVEGKKISITFN